MRGNNVTRGEGKKPGGRRPSYGARVVCVIAVAPLSAVLTGVLRHIIRALYFII